MQDIDVSLLKDIGFIDIRATFDSYSDKMTLSQVILFFERQNIIFSKTMIQNYVRVGVLPPLLSKRYYTKDHVFLLIIINMLKEVCSLENLKSIFELASDDLDITGLYNEFISLIKKGDILKKHKHDALNALLLLTHNAINLKLVKNIVKKY